ncbi:MAG: DUF4157 domain-containing protein [Methanoregula sp.]|jgi:hypothetical protein
MSETTRMKPEEVPAKRAESVSPATETPLHEPADSPVLKIIGIQQTAGNVAVQRILNSGRLKETRKNETGLPDSLKDGVERLSGRDISEVRVHYNSEKPFGIGALAYTRGTDIHIAPGQESHLPHEAWHVVQQAEGRVRPTFQLKDAGVNDDAGLEAEADTMGKRAQLMSRDPAGDQNTVIWQSQPVFRCGFPTIVQSKGNIIQAVWIKTEAPGVLKWNAAISGVRWFTKDELYWFEIENEEGAIFSDFAGKNYTREEWHELGAVDASPEELHYWSMRSLLPPSRAPKPFGKPPTEEKELPIVEKEEDEKKFEEKKSEKTQKEIEKEKARERYLKTKGYNPRQKIKPSSKKIVPAEPENITHRGPTMSKFSRKMEFKGFTNTQFSQWLNDEIEEPKQMNCWEAVFYAAVHAGIRTKEYVKTMIQRDTSKDKKEEVPYGGLALSGSDWTPMFMRYVNNFQDIPSENPRFFFHSIPLIPRGYVIIFGRDGQHVVLSEGIKKSSGDFGTEHMVLELDSDTNGVKSSSIEEICQRNPAYRKAIAWGPLP